MQFQLNDCSFHTENLSDLRRLSLVIRRSKCTWTTTEIDKSEPKISMALLMQPVVIGECVKHLQYAKRAHLNEKHENCCVNLDHSCCPNMNFHMHPLTPYCRKTKTEPESGERTYNALKKTSLAIGCAEAFIRNIWAWCARWDGLVATETTMMIITNRGIHLLILLSEEKQNFKTIRLHCC